MLTYNEYAKQDGLGLAELVAKGEVTAAELLETAIARVQEVNPQLNAVVHPMYDYARKAAARDDLKGPFAGVPFLLKDLLCELAGVPHSSGSRFYRDYRPERNTELANRYLASGVVVAGKTNTPELGLLPTTEPELWGPSRNPWDRTRTTGGSSGGSAAAVASGMVPMASGGDGGGSIRIPSSCCGLFGHVERLAGHLAPKALLRSDTLLEQASGEAFAFVPWTPIFNVTGQPSMSVPLCTSSAGLPMGMMFTGKLGDEATLLRLAGQLEQARPWRDKRPPL